jgi:hypothetical protein
MSQGPVHRACPDLRQPRPQPRLETLLQGQRLAKAHVELEWIGLVDTLDERAQGGRQFGSTIV